MKATIIAITLICGCIISSYSQINQNHKRDVAADSLSKLQYNINPALRNKKTMNPSGFPYDKITEPFMLNENQWSSMPQNTLAQGSMPCYKPEGIFPMPVIKPDTTTRYTMLIK